jgi:hypothetical protein
MKNRQALSHTVLFECDKTSRLTTCIPRHALAGCHWCPRSLNSWSLEIVTKTKSNAFVPRASPRKMLAKRAGATAESDRCCSSGLPAAPAAAVKATTPATLDLDGMDAKQPINR